MNVHKNIISNITNYTNPLDTKQSSKYYNYKHIAIHHTSQHKNKKIDHNTHKHHPKNTPHILNSTKIKQPKHTKMYKTKIHIRTTLQL